MGAGQGEKRLAFFPRRQVSSTLLAQKLDMQERFHCMCVVLWLKRLYFLGAFYKMRKAALSFVSSVCPLGTKSPYIGRIFRKVKYSLKICREKFRFELNLTCLTDSLHEDQNVNVCDRTFLCSCYKEKCFRQNLQWNSKDILCSETFFFNIVSLFCMGVKLGRWHWGRKGSWGCLRIWCWGEYLDLGGTR
jgi:hypothetical protein